MSKDTAEHDSPNSHGHFVGRTAFADDPGSSSTLGRAGIDGYWHEFGDQLRAVGFDPLVSRLTG